MTQIPKTRLLFSPMFSVDFCPNPTSPQKLLAELIMCLHV
ncbi:MAG: hypothetical protein OJF51_004510 [Nitrospira sp.]|nr:MAG: hypothetical protein OJF51_004510 [Nitrospira sp.]